MILRNVKPQNLLSKKDIRNIHSTSMYLMEKTGVEFLHKDALKIFKDNGVKVEDKRIYLTSNIVEKMIKSIPSSFTLHARNHKNDVKVGENNTIMAPGYGAPFVTDLDNGRRRSKYEDYVNLTKLASYSNTLDVLGGVLVEPNDIPKDIRHAKMLYA